MRLRGGEFSTGIDTRSKEKTLGENPSRRYRICWIDLPTRLLEPLLENEPISNGRWNRQEARKRKCLDTSVYGAS